MLLARPTWAEVNLANLVHNFLFFRTNTEKKVMAVVKADAYGHGAVMVAKKLQEVGADYLAVASLEEALILRENQITLPILVFGYIREECFHEVAKNDITISLFQQAQIEEITNFVEREKKPLKIHVKIDTGMNRVGLKTEELLSIIKKVKANEWLNLEGIYSHYASADEEDEEFSSYQQDRFLSILQLLKEEKIIIPLIHMANTAGSIHYSNTELAKLYNMVRVGIGLYGYSPSIEVKNLFTELKPLLTFKSKIVMLKKIKPNEGVGYGQVFKADAEEVIATIPVGYADGLPRQLSNKGEVLIRGVKAPIVGRISMDQITVKVTHIKNVSLYDEVVIYGKQKTEEINVEQVAEQLNTISYELLCRIGNRVPRIYTP